MDRTTEPSPRLPYDLMQYAMRLPSAPTGAEMEAACREAWDRFTADRPAGAPVQPTVPFDEFRRVFEATLARNTALLTRPAA